MAYELHAEKPNNILYFDFQYMYDTVSSFKYVLLMRDDSSSFTMLHPTECADEHAACEGLKNGFHYLELS